MVKFFLRNGVCASISGINGWTPLHAAAANGHLECVQLLLQHQAGPSSISDTGKTPLDSIEDRETRYDLRLLEVSFRQFYAYELEHGDYPDMDTCMDEIEQCLRRAGAETSAELHQRISERVIKFGEGG